MKRVALFLFVVFGVLSSFAVLAKKEANPIDQFFSNLRVCSDRNYVLNDTLEFAVFDISSLQYIDDEKNINTAPTTIESTDPDLEVTTPPEAPAADAKTETKKTVSAKKQAKVVVPEKPVCEPLCDIQPLLDNLPKFFYRNLKNKILTQKVPVTLYPAQSPSYAIPLKLFVRIKKIHFKNPVVSKKGVTSLPISLRIYAELVDKRSEETLIKYYDEVESSLATNRDQAKEALDQISGELMNHLAIYLQTKY